MKRFSKWVKCAACAVLVLAILLSNGSAFSADAASSSITVTNALTGDKLYAGESLQEAFDASVKGSVVSVGRAVYLTENVILRAEVLLSGYTNIRFGDYKIQLTGDGAMFVEERIRTKYIGALCSYSEVEMMEESGGYVYYLVTQAPSFEGEKPAIDVSGNVLGVQIDDEADIIFQDVIPEGIRADHLAEQVQMKATYAEEVTVSFQNTLALDGRKYIVNGTAMTLAATNFDYNGSVKKNYTIILLGDVNGNGKVDAADAMLIARHANGTSELTGNALLAADANRDGVVSTADAEFICAKYVRRDSYKSPLAR